MTILVPIDATAPSRAAVEVATALAARDGSDLVLMHVHPGPEPAGLDLLASLHGIAEPVRSLGVSVRLRVRTGDPIREVCGWAQRHGMQLVVTGTRGGPLVGTESAPSMARALMKCSTVPVLAVRPGRGGLGPGPGPVRLVADQPSLASEVAQLLAEVWDRVLEPSSIAQLPADVRSQTDGSLTVLAFDPTCSSSHACGRLVEKRPEVIVLVSDVSCGCRRVSPS